MISFKHFVLILKAFKYQVSLLILKLSDFVIWLHVIVLQSLAQIIADVLWMKHMGTQV